MTVTTAIFWIEFIISVSGSFVGVLLGCLYMGWQMNRKERRLWKKLGMEDTILVPPPPPRNAGEFWT